jgi:ribonuclease P protein component
VAKPFSYNKKEKLKSRKLLDQVFKEGKTFTVFPLKLFYLQPAEKMDFFIKTGVGVSGRNFKKAVQRNHVKRLLREAYRTEKTPLHNFLQQQNSQAVVFILYIDKTLPVFTTVKEKMPVALKRLVNALNETAVKNT